MPAYPIPLPQGGYAWLPAAGMPFSRGVVAHDGHCLIRVRLQTPLPLSSGFALIARFLDERGRPVEALAGVEIRSPRALSLEAFAAFNHDYIEALRAIGLARGEMRPIARSNMAPLYAPPETNVVFAFTYAAPAAPAAGGRDFVASGIPELKRNPTSIVAPGDRSDAGMQRKIAYVMTSLRAVVSELGTQWSSISGAQAYCAARWECIMAALEGSGLDAVGLTLFPAHPPVEGLDFEVDVRAVSREETLSNGRAASSLID